MCIRDSRQTNTHIGAFRIGCHKGSVILDSPENEYYNQQYNAGCHIPGHSQGRSLNPHQRACLLYTSLDGFLITLKLSLTVIITSTLLGVICGMLFTLKNRGIRSVLRVYVELFRGCPLLMQLFMGYYGLAYLGIQIDIFSAVVLVYTLYGAVSYTHLDVYKRQPIIRPCHPAAGRRQW